MATDKEVMLSILVPVHGVEKFIERSARSLFAQSMKEGVEFIFTNDATPDGSIDRLRAVLDDYPERRGQVRILNHEVNRGLAAARLTGLKAARGRYILFCDSDDYFQPDMAQTLCNAAEASGADLVVADYWLSYKRRERYVKCGLSEGKDLIIDYLINGKGAVGTILWNKLFRRHILLNHKIYPIDGHDYAEASIILVPYLMCTSRMVKVDKALVHYVQTNSKSITKTFSRQNLDSRFESIDYLAARINEGTPDGELLQLRQNALDVRRFREKLVALIHSDGNQQRRYLALYPELDYRKLLTYVPRHWRLPYKMALLGHLPAFNLLRSILLSLKSLTRHISP
ncbi:MAG: glycosyltransferase [Muribaculaceae bacterium]|nr:glycosyltransferase [Muribaculaceae bacterium]MDE5968437.1 glycosyltransferase [Muribaculaceae bacterium]